MSHHILDRKDFVPNKRIMVRVQFGDIFHEEWGMKIVWNPPKDMILYWSDNCNLRNEPGIVVAKGGIGFAGFSSKYQVYTRYLGEMGTVCLKII